MAPLLQPLKAPVAIRPEHVATAPTRLRVKQHTKSWSGGDFTIFASPDTDTESGESSQANPTELFKVDGDVVSWSERKFFRDASGLPLFELHRKKSGVTWFVSLPGADDRSIATCAPQFHLLKDKFDVYIQNAAADGAETKLEVRGNDIWKYRTNVYYDGALVMTTKIKGYYQVYIPVKRPEWDVQVAQGFDLCLTKTRSNEVGILLKLSFQAAIITVMLADALYRSSLQSSHTRSESSSSRPESDQKLPEKS
ncbi:hypothetical protein N7462_003816 [Penicillium macrosclerotiorum]|uniref:uncharacterized protein n=1 Tax=Penicillium macrosclerotiorum TaxID=303699 RepID=UPI0025466E89|nr:uncharacterized protein N7462_003816 [Penicillium macrosclerotiorum]KAJ5689424.1 hypothetical protein N7462_003816 [Penicillium macrosclerotiorum]